MTMCGNEDKNSIWQHVLVTSSHEAFEVQNLEFSNQQNPTFKTMQFETYDSP